MNTSRKPFLSEVLDGDRIPVGTLSYFRERFRDRLYDLVIEEFLKQSEKNDLTRADVARRIGRRPEQITRWFGAPGNWTLETVSDLLLAIARAEPDVTLLPLEGRAGRNYRGQDLSAQHLSEAGGRMLPESAHRAYGRHEELSAQDRSPGFDWNHPGPTSIQDHGGRHGTAFH